MAWCRPGDKPLSEAMMLNLLTHIYITRSQCVNDMQYEIDGPKKNGFVYFTRNKIDSQIEHNMSGGIVINIEECKK